MEEPAIKIKWYIDVYLDKSSGIWKFKDTKLPLAGKYEDVSGTIYYFKNGKRHNENGPAYIEKGGDVTYCINGKIHRIDGPAVIYSYGYVDWWINGYYIDNETMENWLEENDISLDWYTWTESDKMLFALHWSDYKG